MENMSDLISREALKEATKGLYNETLDGIVKFGIEKAYDLIDKAPTVDFVSPTINVNIPEETKQKLIEELQKPPKLLVLPEPEVTFERLQGEWKITDSYPHKVYCDKCFKTYAQENWEVWKDGSLPRNFCPNCGAKMWKGGDEE